MNDVHGFAAQVALVLSLVMGGAAMVIALTRRATGSFFLAGALWTGLVVALAALLGLAEAVSDHPPKDPLHIIYGVLAVGVIPGGALVAGGQTARRRAIVWAIATIVLVILILRLFQTGG